MHPHLASPLSRLTAFALACAAASGCSGGGPSPTLEADAGPRDAGPRDAGLDGPALPPPIDTSDVPIDTADVALLYPIAADTLPGSLVPATEAGGFGPLLAEQLGPLSLRYLDDGAGFSTLRLIGIRLDPCAARGGCTSEVRLVFQPVAMAAGAPTAVGDGAVHAFYDVPADELATMLREILALKKLYGAGVPYGAVLAVHPLLAAGGLDGPFASGLRAVVRAHLGLTRLARVTVLTHDGTEGHSWGFQIVDRGAAGFGASTIVDTDATSQSVNGSSARDPELGVATYDTSGIPTLAALAPLVGDRPAAPTGETSAGFAVATALLEPDVHTSETVDCLSCHLAEGARRAGVDVFGYDPRLTAPTARSIAYRRDGAAVTNLHAFGYVDRAVSVMQRTAIEAAVSADRFTALRATAR